MRSRCLLLLVFAASVFVAGAQTASAGGADAARLAATINAERAAAGLPVLSTDRRLTALAEAQAARMAEADRLFHNPTLASNLAGWALLGENVGKAGTFETLHRAFMASPGHRANILGTYDRFGVAAVRRGLIIYAAEVFGRTAPPAAARPRRASRPVARTTSRPASVLRTAAPSVATPAPPAVDSATNRRLAFRGLIRFV